MEKILEPTLIVIANIAFVAIGILIFMIELLIWRGFGETFVLCGGGFMGRSWQASSQG